MASIHERMDDELLDGGADWGLIRAFVEVVRSGTLSAAARNLGATQPTMGRQMRRLEALSGEPLFLRKGRELEPTERARRLYEAAVQIEVEVTALARAFAAGARGPGIVRITTSEIFGAYVLPELLGPILDEDPNLEVEVMAHDRLDNLVRRDADIAIRFMPPTQPELIATKVGEVEVGVFAAESLIQRLGEPRGLADLQEWPWVSSASGSEVIDAFREAGLRCDPARLRVRSDSLPVRLNAMECGLGAGGMAIGVASRRARLRQLFDGKVIHTFPIWIVAHDEIRRDPRLRLVFDRLRDSIRQLVRQREIGAAAPTPAAAAAR